MSYDDSGYINISFTTNISNTYFDDKDDTDRFDEWLNKLLLSKGFFDYGPTFTPEGVPGISKIVIRIDEFDYNHDISVHVNVDDYTHTFDELYDNEALIRYMEKEVAPTLVDEFNKLLADEHIVFPMSRGGTEFRDMKFEYGEFYCMLGHTDKYGYYPYGDVREASLVVEDFEVSV